MRRATAVMLILVGCSDEPSTVAPAAVAATPRSITPTAPVSDLRFNDDQLQKIAVTVTREARLHGIEVAPGKNRVERLLWLEGRLGNSSLALARTNTLVAQMTATDASQWGELRQQAAREFSTRDDEVAGRVHDMLTRWQQRKTESVFQYLSSNYRTTYISSLNWEQRFHDFIIERPMDAATWGWLVSRAYAAETRQQYGRASSESAYRFYLEFSGLGDGREARRIFSVPGIEITAAR